MTRPEAEDLLHLFSAAGLWVRVRESAPDALLLEIRDDAIYGLRRVFQDQGHARFFLMEQGY